MRKYTILFLSHERKLGGASRSLVALAEELQSMGHSIYVVVLLKKCPLAMELKKKGIKIIPIFFGWWMCPEYWSPLLKFTFKFLYWMEWIAQKQILRIVKRYGIEIIHSNSSTIDLGAKVAKRANIKHVWHFREFGLEDFQLEYMKGRKKSIQFVENNADGIVFISKKLRNSYLDLKCDEKIRVIYNGISDSYLQKRNFVDNKEIVYFLVSGTLVKNKNQILAVYAAKKLIEEGYYNFRLQIAGASTSLYESQMYEKEIKNYIESNSMQQYVTMLGYIKDMNEIRRGADIEVIASRSEAFGRVTVEAMMSSMPVIGSDEGANPEIIKQSETGLLFKSNDAEALTEAMKKFLDSPQEIKRMGENGYNLAKELFTAEQNAKAIEKFYIEIMERRNKNDRTKS